MSADNYWLVRNHLKGGYAVLMGFASDDTIPAETATGPRFERLVDAITHATEQESEYGVQVHPECFEQYAKAGQ